MITAVDARRLQSEGVSQDEWFERASKRCNDAIVDVSRNRQESRVDVLVFKLKEETLEKLAEDLRFREFEVHANYQDDKKSVLTIIWSH